MLKYFIDPDGEKLLIKDCLEKGLLSKYYPLAYLNLCAEQREWTGKPSTTMLINGTRMEYLKILTPYAESPDSQAFRVLGTKSHAKLELYADEKAHAEIGMDYEEITGITDMLEMQEDGTYWLIDYKTWGSYKVGKALGIVKKERDLLDENGTPVLYKRSGRNYTEGDVKKDYYYEQDINAVDIRDVELQLNRYRVALQICYGIKISKMLVFCIVRDGGTYLAKNRGIKNNTYYIEIKEIPDEEIRTIFNDKKYDLTIAVSEYNNKVIRTGMIDSLYQETLDLESLADNCPIMCTDAESWNGKRCESYCPVAEMCHKIEEYNQDRYSWNEEDTDG